MRKNNKKIKTSKLQAKYRRKLHTRVSLSGDDKIPRICISKSNKNVYVQVVDDVAQKTLFSVQTFGKDCSIKGFNKNTVNSLAHDFISKSKDKNLNKFVFDRSGNRYSGLIKTFADSLRESGLKL
jgi:large subunit ribosomal protein L18